MNHLHIAIIAILAYSTTSCGFSPVEAYIRESAPDLQTLEIVSDGGIDSVSSPTKELMTLIYFYGKASKDVCVADVKAFEAKSKKESIAIINEALSAAREVDSLYREAFFDHTISVDFPTVGRFNRIGKKVKYRINGILNESLFIFDVDGKKIVTTSADNKKLAIKTIDERFRYQKNVRDLESLLRNINAGRERMHNWE